MVIERAFSIIKSNAVTKNIVGGIFARFEAVGSKVIGTKMLHLTVRQACGFYTEHDGKSFFGGLVEFMASGLIVVSILESGNATQHHHDPLNATSPANTLAGTLRTDYADSFTGSGTHGSDSAESTTHEIAYFFGEGEVCPRTCQQAHGVGGISIYASGSALPGGDADASYQAYDLPLHIIFASASCKRDAPASDFAQCNAPEEQIACRDVSF